MGAGLPWRYRIRLSVIGGAERKLVVSAPELTTENGAECRPAQGESASRTVMAVVLPAQLFFLIEPLQGIRLAGRMRNEIDVVDRGIADFS